MLRFAIFIFLFSFGESYKILITSPLPSGSHNILGEGLVRILAEKHEVTYITAIPRKVPPKNYRQIDVSANAAFWPENLLNTTKVILKENIQHDMIQLFLMLTHIQNATYSNPAVQKLMYDDKEHFDLVIVEWMFSNLAAGISEVFNCPYVWLSTVDPHWGVLRLTDEPLNPAHNADPHSVNAPPLNFYQRVQELWIQIRDYYTTSVVQGNLENDLYNNLFGPPVARKGRTLTPYFDKIYQASLILGNTHATLGSAIRLPQNYIPIGGYHIEPEVKPLPEDLKKILDGSKHGVIFFSLGSNLKSKDLPEKVKKELLEMLGSLKYTVLWKFEEQLQNLPKNVHIMKWAAQPSILAHPNTVLFITHGGLLSITETVHYGVPIIGVPGFADQFSNVKRAQQKGFGVEVELSFELASDLKKAIDEVLGDPKYKQKVKELSLAYHDRVVPPARELIHWAEHVIKTGGATYLASPALHLPFYQKLYLDLLLVLLVVLYVLKIIVKKVFSVFFGKKVVKKQKKTN